MDKRKPKLFNTRAIVMKDGFPCGDKAVYSPSLFKFNSLAIRAMPLERAIYPIVLKSNSISFSSSAASRYAITSSFVSISSAGSYLRTFTFPILFSIFFKDIITGYFSSLFYIRLLSGFVTAVKQDNNSILSVLESSRRLVINTVAWSVINNQFRQTVSNRLPVTWISFCKPFNTDIYSGFCTLVFQLFEPLNVGFCPAYPTQAHCRL